MASGGSEGGGSTPSGPIGGVWPDGTRRRRYGSRGGSPGDAVGAGMVAGDGAAGAEEGRRRGEVPIPSIEGDAD